MNLKSSFLPAVLILLGAFHPSAEAQKVPIGNALLAEQPDQKQHSILLMSDIHFDPFANPALVPRLQAATVEEWKQIFESDSNNAFSKFGTDSNYALFSEWLRHSKARVPNPALILIPGDFISHDFKDYFKKDSRTQNSKGYSSFVVKTIEFVANEIQAAFPKAQIITVPGNNDATRGDYVGNPNSEFLSEFAKAWKNALGSGSEVPGAYELFRKKGYFSVNADFNSNIRIIALNTTYFSKLYRGVFLLRNRRDGDHQIAWLKTELQTAKQLGQKVWIIEHIPPGVDPYSTVKTLGALPSTEKGEPTLCYSDYFDTKMISLLRENISTIGWMISGHTHSNEFRVISNGSEYFVNQLIPSLSPNHGNNPSFEVAEIEDQKWTPSRLESDILKLNDSKNTVKQPTWVKVQPTTPLVEHPELSTYQAKFNSDDMKAQFKSTFGSQNGKDSAADSWRWKLLSCSFFSPGASDFQSCAYGEK